MADVPQNASKRGPFPTFPPCPAWERPGEAGDICAAPENQERAESVCWRMKYWETGIQTSFLHW